MNCISKVKVTDVLHHNTLVTREAASFLMQAVSEKPCDNVELDFEGINFISRSFADQFHKLKLKHAETGKEIICRNQEHDVLQMFQSVSKTQTSTDRAYRTYPVIRLTSKRLKHDYFSTL